MAYQCGDVVFYVLYRALGNGLTTQTFEYICQGLLREAAEFDDKLRKVGLLS